MTVVRVTPLDVKSVADPRGAVHSSVMKVDDADSWFVQEVLPLEASLMRYLRRNWRNDSEIADLRQEVYARVYEKALTAIPAQAKPFVFMTARNLIIDRLRRLRVVSIETVSDMEALDVAADDLTPDRIASAREELRCLNSALDALPPRCREVVALRKIEGLSQREVAARLGVKEDTIEHHVAKGMRALADALTQFTSVASGKAPEAPKSPLLALERGEE